MIEKQINPEIFPADLKRNLVADKGKANAQFD